MTELEDVEHRGITSCHVLPSSLLVHSCRKKYTLGYNSMVLSG